jgi:hypothetical protein
MFAAYRSGVQEMARQIFAAHRSGVQEMVRKSVPAALWRRGLLLKGHWQMNESDIKPGYVYHIKNTYFDTANDDKLMRNHEDGAYRPTYFCVEDKKIGLLWVVPMSTRIEKFNELVQKDIRRYGECLKIVIGEYADKGAAFLLQNMFPILSKYIDHIHLVKHNPVPVNTRLQIVIERNFREILRLQRRGIKIVFPDIVRLEKLMLDEREREIEV